MKLFFVFSWLLYGFFGIAQNVLLPTYNDYIEIIIQNNPLSQRAKNEKLFAELKLKSARGNYDPYLNGDVNQKQFSGTNYFTTLSSEIKQPIFTNQYLKVGFDYGAGPNLNPELFTPTQGLLYIGGEIGVLQGLRIDKRRAEVLKFREYINYYDAEQKIQLNSLLFESSITYFEWLFSAQQIALNNYFMESAKTRLFGIEALANIGELPTIDTIEASIFYQTRLLDLQNALLDNIKSTNELSTLMWQNNTPSNKTNSYKTKDSLDYYYTKAKLVVSENLNFGQIDNPIISKYNAYQKVLNVDVRYKKELIKPELNLKYNFLSNNSSPINPAFSTNNYKWGVNLAFPLLFRNSVNEYKVAKLISQNNSLELKDKSNELDFKINSLRQSISIISIQLINSERTVNYSKILLEGEKLKFENGESSVFMINTRESKLLEAELKLAEYKLKFIKAVLNLIYLNGNFNYRF